MRRIHWFSCSLLLTSLLACSQAVGQDGIAWRGDLEAAKAEAAQSGRLVLAHFWTPSCGPCLRLDGTVFNQPTVASSLETRFVPVKINADQNVAVAQRFGITQVPTDVVLTPQGQVVGKTVSPSTPTAYVSEMIQIANRLQSRSGAAFEQAVAGAANAANMNQAYAGLNIGQPAPTAPATPPPAAAAVQAPPLAQTVGNRYAQAGQSAAAATNYPAYQAPPATPAVTTTTPSQAPAVGGRYATVVTAPPSAQPSSAAQQPMPARVTNQYVTAPQQQAAPQQRAIPQQQFAQQPMPQMQVAAQQTTPPAAPSYNPPAAGVATAQVTPIPGGAAQPVGIAGQVAAAANPIAANTPTATPNVAPPTQAQLPPGMAPLAFDGYCPVSMKKHWRWVPGDVRWGVQHRGRTYLFAGPAEKDEFYANPDFYAPALSGQDPVVAIDQKQAVDGSREHSLEYNGQFYLFSSEQTLQQFSSNPEQYATGVRQAMGLTPAAPVRR